MYEKFMAIDSEKQERIMNAAYKEFAYNSYSQASTNEIAKAAGISKGLLFHYFTSKKELYLYLYDYAANAMSEETKEHIDAEERDLFVKLKQMSHVSLRLFDKYPDMLQFMKKSFYEEDNAVQAEIAERNKLIAANEYNTVLMNVDMDKFKDGVDALKALNVIVWTMEGMAERERMRHRLMGGDMDIAAFVEEFDHYLEMFRQAFYK